jgi:hypothetical protein
VGSPDGDRTNTISRYGTGLAARHFTVTDSLIATKG